MSDTSVFILDGLTRHQIFIQRLGGRYVNELLPLIKQMNRDISSLMASATSEYDLFRYARVNGELEQIIQSSVDDLGSQLQLDLNEFAEYEADFTARLMNNATSATFNIPSVDRIIATINETPMQLVSGKNIESLTIDQMVRTYSASKSQLLGNTIRSGIIEGNSVPEIAKQVNLLSKSKNASDAEAVVRTAVNHVGSMARKAVYDENKDVIRAEEWVSKLDHRTTLICAHLDETIFEVGEGVYPPRHYRCRSVRVPLTNARYNRKIKGVGAKSKNAESYGAWLRKQPENVQNEVLGVTKAKLFRSGGLPVDKFTDDQDRTLNLAELRSLDPLAFERAGV